ncbi:hypothetical protein PUN28_005299 [Cardiocondyla obscurior]|uniref:Uncharacterized protein n=1 Tax=Cardiocondyla obscurior TaxID=286306 RepID=A0AAW2GGR1_9HYME
MRRVLENKYSLTRGVRNHRSRGRARACSSLSISLSFSSTPLLLDLSRRTERRECGLSRLAHCIHVCINSYGVIPR